MRLLRMRTFTFLTFTPMSPTLTTSTTILWVLHWVAATIWLAGAIFLILWAIRSLTPSHLLAWGVGLFIAGILGTMLTIPAALTGLRSIQGSASTTSTTERMMTMMQTHDAGSDPTAHAQHQQMETMMHAMLGDDRSPQLR